MNIYNESDIPQHLKQYFEPAEIGLEETPEQYVNNIVQIFREVWRVLRDDGTVWLNLGDSYTSSAIKTGNVNNQSSTLEGGKSTQSVAGSVSGKFSYDTKIKVLVGIPWRVAFALQDDGWYLRQDIIWHKPNPMPESVRDRCTKAHEYVFMLTKSTKYYFDHEAVKEPCSENMQRREKNGHTRGGGGKLDQSRSDHNTFRGEQAKVIDTSKGRNRRSVWTITTRPYKGAHFATFPPALIEPCILAGSAPGDTVLDPFAGSGTTGQVALDHGRSAVLIELNPEYVGLIEERVGKENIES